MKESSDCYCVCHSPYASRAFCEHCKGDNDVTRHHRAKAMLKENPYLPEDYRKRLEEQEPVVIDLYGEHDKMYPIQLTADSRGKYASPKSSRGLFAQTIGWVPPHRCTLRSVIKGWAKRLRIRGV